MRLLDNELYVKDLEAFAASRDDWSALKDASLLISGATGLIGSFIIDAIMKMNEDGLGCHIFALGRNEEKAKNRFEEYWDSDLFTFVKGDVAEEINLDEQMDYIIHAASTTHPRAYATEPIGTLMVNIMGLKNLLDYAYAHNNKRFAFLSSVEVYGENRGDVEKFDEKYLGYINCNTLRAGYPESKRAGEALCQAYIAEKEMDIVIPRLARTYGPTMLMSDSKALSQFIKKGLAKEDIVLKSEGTQLYSYTYVVDAAIGLMLCLIDGKKGEAYNIADPASDVMLKELAAAIAESAGTKVVFELPDATEAAGYSTATKAMLSGEKIKSELGWKALYNIDEGIKNTLEILKEN